MRVGLIYGNSNVGKCVRFRSIQFTQLHCYLHRKPADMRPTKTINCCKQIGRDRPRIMFSSMHNSITKIEDQFNRPHKLSLLFFFAWVLVSYSNLISVPKGFNKSQVAADISFESLQDNSILPECAQTKHRGKNLEWNLLKKFDTEHEANAFLRAEKIWSRKFANQCYDGEKIHYRCKLVPRRRTQCSANLLLFKSSTSLKCEIFTSGEHTHDNVAVIPIRSDDIKSTILSMSKAGSRPAAIFKYLKETQPENCQHSESLKSCWWRKGWRHSQHW